MVERRLYCPDLFIGQNRPPPEEARHLVASLRGREGDTVILFDGQGHEAEGVVERADRRGVFVDVREIRTRTFDSPIRLTLAAAMARQHRQAFLIEKCTELGVAAFLPLVTDRGVATAERAALARWERRAIEAAKQCGRAWLPGIRTPESVERVMAVKEKDDRVYAAHPDAESEPFSRAVSTLRPGGALLVLIGPEGGWSPRELDLFEQHQVTRVSLAPSVLRVETAAEAVCAVVAAHALVLMSEHSCA